MPPTPYLGSPGGIFRGGQKLGWFLCAFLRLFPALRRVWGSFFFSSAHLGLRFSLWTPQHTEGFGGVLEPHMCGVKQEGNWGAQTGPMMLMMLGCWALNMHYKPQRNAQNTCCGSVCGCKHQRWWDLHCKTSMRQVWRTLPMPNPIMPYKVCMLHGLCVFAHISSTL